MKKEFFLLLFLIIIFSSCSSIRSNNSEAGDYLLYVIDNYPSGQGKVFLYNPATNEKVPVLMDFNVFSISISTDNRLAFSSNDNEYSHIYVVDYPFTNNNPLNITEGINLNNSPISWSPDGKYLAFQSFQDKGGYLMIWDGENISEIYQFEEFIWDDAWGPGHQLVFTEHSYTDDPSEIFIWDGNQAVNLSQNPFGIDIYPAWNSKGQLAFLSERHGEYDIFVWDGKSKKNNIPDTDSFINIAPSLTGYMSQPEWNHKDLLTFTGSTSSEYFQIYEWNGQTAHNISQNPGLNNGGQKWRSDGYWSFITFFSNQIYIRNDKNQTILSTKGEYVPAWSQNGYLMFCNKTSSGWSLSVWNGKTVLEIDKGFIISAQWRNGAGVSCTSG